MSEQSSPVERYVLRESNGARFCRELRGLEAWAEEVEDRERMAAMRIQRDAMGERLQEVGVLGDLHKRMDGLVVGLDVAHEDPGVVKRGFETKAMQFAREELERAEREGEVDWRLEAEQVYSLPPVDGGARFVPYVVENASDYDPFLRDYVARAADRLENQVRAAQGLSHRETGDLPEWEWKGYGGGGNGVRDGGGDDGRAKVNDENRPLGEVEALRSLRGLMGYERSGSISAEVYNSYLLAIAELSSDDLRSYFTVRLKVLADVTEMTSKTNPRKKDEPSEGLSISLEQDDLEYLLGRNDGTMQAMKKLLEFAGFEYGEDGDIPDQTKLLRDVVGDEEGRGIFGDRWATVSKLNYWKLEPGEVTDFRKALAFWVAQAQEKGIDRLGEFEVVETAAVVESLFKHTRLTVRFETDDSHVLHGASCGFEIMQPYRKAGNKTYKFGVHREYVNGRFSRELNTDTQSERLFSLTERELRDRNFDFSLGGLFMVDLATSYWLSPYNIKSSLHRNIKDMLMGNPPHVPSAKDFKMPFYVRDAGHLWGSAAKIEAYYAQAKVLGGVGEKWFAQKFLISEPDSVQTLLKNLQMFETDLEEGADAQASYEARAAFVRRRDNLLKSILLARIGVSYDELAPDGLRINMDKDDMYALIMQLRARKFRTSMGEIGSVSAELAEWLLEHARSLNTEEARERYWRMTTGPLREWYARWMTAVESGEKDERSLCAAVIRYIEVYEDFVRYNSLTPAERQLQVGDSRLFYAVPFNEKLAVLPPKTGETEKLKSPERLEFPLKEGWMKPDGQFVAGVNRLFRQLARAGYFAVTDEVTLKAEFDRFIEVYLFARLGLYDGRLVVTESEGIREDALAEVITVLGGVPVYVEYIDGEGSIGYEEPLVNERNQLKKKLMGMVVYSLEPWRFDLRRRRGFVTGRDRPAISAREHRDADRYRRLVIAKATGVGFARAATSVESTELNGMIMPFDLAAWVSGGVRVVPRGDERTTITRGVIPGK